MLCIYEIMNILSFLSLIFLTNSYVVFSNRICKSNRQFYLKDKFVPVTDEKTIQLKHDNMLFNKIQNSFFGQIGSNPKHYGDEDYHWFDGDGMIHGIFFNNSLITYQNKWIQTKRLEIESKWKKKMYLYFGELKGLRGLYQILKFSFMELLGFLPQAKGTANTAMLKWKKRVFALHEGDMPYELNIDHENFNISTSGRFFNEHLYSATAHPIIDKKRNLLYLYGYNNYNFLDGNFIFNIFDEDMNLLDQKNITLINNGMTHDVGFTGDDIIIPDMPLKYDVNRIIKEELPLYFDKEKGNTRFGVFNVEKRDDPRWFDFDENFFIFHFSKSYKKGNEYIIYACVMDNLFMEDFVELDNINNEEHLIRGKLRLKEIHLNLDTNKTHIVENNELENLNLDFNYNLDFPVQSSKNSNYVYCAIFDSGLGYIKGYVKIDIFNFKNSKPRLFLFEKNTYGNSEAQVVIIDDVEHLVTFTNNNSHSYISLINMENGTIENIEIPTRIPPGFHSIYYKN